MLALSSLVWFTHINFSRPFKAGSKTHSLEELTDVSDFARGSNEFAIDESQVRRLLEQANETNTGQGFEVGHNASHRSWLVTEDLDHDLTAREFACCENGSEMVLTREERQRSSGIASVEYDDRTEDVVEQYGHGEDAAHDCDKENNLRLETHSHLDAHVPAVHTEKNQDSGISFVPHDIFRHQVYEYSGYDLTTSALYSDKENLLPIADLLTDEAIYAPPPTSNCMTSGNTLDTFPLEAASDTRPQEPLVSIRPLGAAQFAMLRGKRVRAPEPDILIEPEKSKTPQAESTPCTVPEDLVDYNTLRLPCPFPPPSTLHRYLTSMGVVQKQTLVRSFRTQQCAVELVEHETLGDVDLVLDPHSAVFFTSLLSLPFQCEAIVSRLCQQSWRFSQLLVVLEAYQESHSYVPDREMSTRTKINCYTPMIIKAVKKLRRNLGVSEACDTKNPACSVFLAFADSVGEAALLTRYFGDLAEANDVAVTGGAVWGNRDWLDASIDEVFTSFLAYPAPRSFDQIILSILEAG